MALPRASGQGHRWAGFLTFHIASVLMMVAVMATVPDPSGAVALVFAPSNNASQAFIRAARSGGRPIRQGNFDWIVVVMPEDRDTEFTKRAFAAGALAIVNPLLAGGCARAVSRPDLHHDRTL